MEWRRQAKWPAVTPYEISRHTSCSRKINQNKGSAVQIVFPHRQVESMVGRPRLRAASATVHGHLYFWLTRCVAEQQTSESRNPASVNR